MHSSGKHKQDAMINIARNGLIDIYNCLKCTYTMTILKIKDF